MRTTTTSSCSSMTAAIRPSAISDNVIKNSSINMEFSKTVQGDVGLNQNTLYACRLSTGRIRNILETA